jgi:sulfotransferase
VYSLQRDSDIRDLPESVVDLQNQIVTWDDTAAAIANLDLVITSCTSVAHLAAAMGKETWIIVPILPYHVWALPGERSPWYDSVRLFRQEVFGNWDAPLQKVKAELLKRVGKQEERTGPLKWEKASFPLPPTPSPAEGALLQEVPQSQAPVFPGFFTAPHPAPAARTRSTQSTMHFVAGLPRAGSTALLSLLAQNPRIYSAPISGLCGIFSGIYMNWDKVEYHIELPNAAAKARILRTLLEHYHETDRPIILDKDRQWITQIALLEKVLERPVKMVLPVRPITEVLASFEVLRRKNPLEFTGADSSLGSNSTIATRAAYFMQADAPVGMAFNAMGDAINSGYRDRLLFVDYNKLTSAPVMQLKRIYEFLEEPYFEHDFSHVEQVARGDSRVHKFPGLHDIHPEFKKKSPSAREVLGNEVFGKYSGTEPWTLWT